MKTETTPRPLRDLVNEFHNGAILLRNSRGITFGGLPRFGIFLIPFLENFQSEDSTFGGPQA